MSTLLICVLALGLTGALPINNDERNPEELGGYYQGDIRLSPHQETALRNGLLDVRYRWPKRVVPYTFADDAFTNEQKNFINRTLEEYNKRTCITVRRSSPDDTNVVEITGTNSGCWSYVGAVGGKQQLNLAPNEPGSGCFRNGTILHEFLHALGFYHEQSSSNRDDYVLIVWDNIQKGTESNFDKYGSDVISDFGYGYDYSSVLHYSGLAFSINGQQTIVPLQQGAQIGQRIDFSPGDIAKLQRMYGCE